MARHLLCCLLGLFHYVATAQPTETLRVSGLQRPVEIVRDRWGIAHIYAQNEHDLFFAQGYTAAQDRLFQLELWRRQATGTVAELLGPRELKRDIGARLFRFQPTATERGPTRGDLTQELNHYHPRGSQIITAFVDGINAYIGQLLKTPDKLPFEFKALGTRPGLWTPDVVVSRHQGLLSNVRDELNYGRLVHLIGADKLRQLQWFHPATRPGEPDLTLHVPGNELFQPILELYEAFRLPLRFQLTDAPNGVPEGVAPEGDGRQRSGLPGGGSETPNKLRPKEPKTSWTDAQINDWFDAERHYVGSNNWVVDGRLSESGFPMLANDPHRAQAVPSLRYWVHLHAPGDASHGGPSHGGPSYGWNVVGAGEPTLPGVSIGHNEWGAWGLTIFETDNEDLYVYDTDPANPNQYRYNGRWEPMHTRRETIAVKGQAPVTVTLKYTRHGPVVFEDAKNHRAYVVRAGWLEPGCAPYLASLRMNQATSWQEFRAACAYSRIPGENMVWAGRPTEGRPTEGPAGHIGWQATGLSPIRKNWSGLVPVPGDGRFEWSGFLPILQLPNVVDPPAGYVVTANNNLTPADYSHRNAVGWVWSGPARAHRIEEELRSGRRHNILDFARLQADYLSVPARTLVPLVTRQPTNDLPTRQALELLRRWDYQLAPNSVAAAIYVAWETQLRQAVHRQLVPENARPYLRSLPTKRFLDALLLPTPARDTLLLNSLTRAVNELNARLGSDPTDWQYGQRLNKHITLTHPLSELVSAEQRKKINLGPLPRGGYGETVNNTGNALNQEHGASFRIIVDTEDWDKTLGINSPGQSANPDSPHYRDLFELWAQNGYFPVYFSRDKLRTVTEKITTLTP